MSTLSPPPLREDIARVWHESYFAHPWKHEDAAGRACALQAADSIIDWLKAKRMFASDVRVTFQATRLTTR